MSTGKAESLLQALGKKIDQLVERAEDSKTDLKDDIKDSIEYFKAKTEKLQEELDEFKSDERWDDVKNHLEKSAQELKKAVEGIFKKEQQEEEK